MKTDLTPNQIHEQIAEKREQINDLKSEIKELRKRLKPFTRLERRAGRPIDWKSSLVGWHNPKEHKGLTPEEFFTKYTERLAKKKHPLYKHLHTQVLANKSEALTFIETKLSKTLSHPAKT